MAKAHKPKRFRCEILPHLPPERQVGHQGGQTRNKHRQTRKVNWRILATGVHWEDAPLYESAARAGRRTAA